MKTTLKSVLFGVLALVSTSTFAIGVQNESNFGWYEIYESEEQLKKISDAPEVYEIVYDILDNPVYVTVKEKGDSKLFIVRGDDFEVQYTYKNQKFGVSYVDKDFAQLSRKESKSRINKNEFSNQKLIVKADKSDEELLQLIASYVPDVIN